jgi:hypothetical protein
MLMAIADKSEGLMLQVFRISSIKTLTSSEWVLSSKLSFNSIVVPFFASETEQICVAVSIFRI